MWRETWLKALSVCAFAVTFPLAAMASKEVPEPSSAWTFDGGLYGWALWLQGDTTISGLEFDIYADPIDLIDALDGPIIMANFEAKHGRFSLYTDIVCAKFHNTSDFMSEANPIAGLTLKGDGRVDGDVEFGVYQFDAFYEVAKFAGAKSKTTFEIGGGVRWVQLDVQVTAAVDLSVTANLGKRIDRLERRIGRIGNQEDRLASLAAVNALRQTLLKKRIVHAESSPIFKRRVARLKRRLNKVENRGEVIAALEELEELRVALLDARINLDRKDFKDGLAFINNGGLDWADPVIAMRTTHAFSNGQSVTAMGDIGGFNSGSDLTWQVVLTYDRKGMLFGYDTTTSLGYKALGLLYEESTNKGKQGVNAILHGPIAELTFHW